MAGGVKISLALSDGTLVAAPTWTDITTASDGSSLGAAFTIDRGRQYELDITDIGSANVAVNDHKGILDPTNSSGPYYGLLEPEIQAKLEILNPVTSTYKTVFRGYWDECDYVFDPSQQVNRLTFSLVDALKLLDDVQMQPDGSFGDVVPPASTGNIFFDNANVDDRILQALGNAGWPAGLETVFSGNVALQESVYSPGDTVLNVVQDAADAEFPGLGNVYASRLGVVTFHGRAAKFDPAGVSAGAGGAWPFTHWKCGDHAAVVASISDTAQIREFAFNRGLSRIINYASATPYGIADADRAGQVVSDLVSIGLRGYHPWSKENLFVASGTTTGNDANDECKAFAEYYVANYTTPRNRVTNLAIRSLSPSDPRAAATWALLTGAEISDLLDVTVASPGGGGFTAEPHFIEGLHYTVNALNGDYADVALRPDLSPQAFFSDGSMFGL